MANDDASALPRPGLRGSQQLVPICPEIRLAVWRKPKVPGRLFPGRPVAWRSRGFGFDPYRPKGPLRTRQNHDDPREPHTFGPDREIPECGESVLRERSLTKRDVDDIPQGGPVCVSRPRLGARRWPLSRRSKNHGPSRKELPRNPRPLLPEYQTRPTRLKVDSKSKTDFQFFVFAERTGAVRNGIAAGV